MKKIIIGIFLIIVIAVGVGVYYVLNNLDSLVEAAIEKYGSEATQTAVLVDGVKIDLSNGAAAITGLTVANSSGFSLPYAFSLAEIRSGIDLRSLQDEPYIIDEITVLAPQVFVEINADNRTNLNELKKNLQAAAPAKTASETQAPAGESGEGPRLIIRRINFADGVIQARAAALDNREYQLKLPALQMNDLGGSKGATATELASEILSRLTDRASKEVKEKIIDAELDKLKAKAQEKIDAEKARLEQKADEELKAQETKVKDKLKGLLGN